uniref:Uncharacterized protein n=1 Tax=Phakopsora pachyrhizi TaxID=170000 RepID=A0A0S1MJT9_PHAPC
MSLCIVCQILTLFGNNLSLLSCRSYPVSTLSDLCGFPISLSSWAKMQPAQIGPWEEKQSMLLHDPYIS